MKMQSWIVTLVAVLAGSAGAAAPAGKPVTVRFPSVSNGECPLVLNGGELTVSNESGKLAFAFKGTATIKSCATKSVSPRQTWCRRSNSSTSPFGIF